MAPNRKQSTWAEVASVLEQAARALKLEWGCDLPRPDTLPSPALGASVDEWCERLAKQLGEPLDPPALVRPWILARLIAAASVAGVLQEQGDTDCAGLSPSIARHFLIDEWHGCLKDRWWMMMIQM